MAGGSPLLFLRHSSSYFIHSLIKSFMDKAEDTCEIISDDTLNKMKMSTLGPNSVLMVLL